MPESDARSVPKDTTRRYGREGKVFGHATQKANNSPPESVSRFGLAVKR